MFKWNPFKRKRPVQSTGKPPGIQVPRHGELLENQLEIKIGDVLVRICRSSDIPPTNELTAVIPRAEFRTRRYEKGQLASEEEIVLSGITLVDAPRHPSEKKPGVNGGPMPPRPTLSGTPAPRR